MSRMIYKSLQRLFSSTSLSNLFSKNFSVFWMTGLLRRKEGVRLSRRKDVDITVEQEEEKKKKMRGL